ncbi:hypothetical protein BCR34DRAFT_607182 [Clohesyomyces aquaticus]|uniref:Protein kinase domain-containing protein n=1 Tax=Clohesyomyces aquaticus TaxID=1231657 RepID=A0A1Y1YI09_9PLEO|nr:hypothetical protein BCR34DRAFT_607182 [Clohesyomyces aquaticus]
MTTKIAFRIQGVPLGWALTDLSSAVAELCDRDEAEHVSIIGTLTKAAEHNVRSQVAVVQFTPKLPSFLKRVLDDETGEMTEHKQLQDGSVLVFDRNFWGLTPLYCPDGELSVDIIAVTGLDGNAYGSWASRKVNAIWLRDFLPKDLPKCRVLTFGYNTKLSLDSNYRFDHFCDELLNALKRSRASDEASSRPLVLLGHSYGTRLITRCICQCKLSDDPSFTAILEWTRVVVFFGAVHRGMKTDDIEEYLKSNFPESIARLRMVEDLRAGNAAALSNLQDFVNLTSGFLVISVHETRKAKTLVNTSVDSNTESATTQPKRDIWRRIGKLYTPVEETSAVIGLPSDSEIAIPSNSDHSNIAKFDSPTDPVYQEILYHLKAIQEKPSPTPSYLASLLQVGAVPATDKRAFHPTGLYRQRVIQIDEDLGVPNNQMEFPQTPSLLRIATSILEEVRSTAKFDAGDIELLDQTDAATRTARRFLTLLSAGRYASPEKQHQSRRIVASVLQIRQSLIGIIDLLDPITHGIDYPLTHGPDSEHIYVQLRHVKLPLTMRHVLADIQQSMNAANNELERTLHDVEVSSPQLQTTLATPKLGEAATRMASSWSRYIPSSQDNVKWIPSDCLYFPVGSENEADRESEGWIQSVLRLFTKSEAKKLKLRPRRFGVVDYNDRQEKVMVEFRPYPDSARANPETAGGGDSSTASTEYKARRWAIERLARTLLANSSASDNAKFPCVPLRYLADMSASSTPSFALVYSANGIYALDEIMQDHYAPHLTERIRLALSYAQALASLHTVDMVHGSFNTENLYLHFAHRPTGPESISDAETLLAGFEVTRNFGWSSDKLDVEDPDRRLYLHPKRLVAGQDKERQQPVFDLFGLGMVLTELGLWKRLRSLPGYPVWGKDHDRQLFGRSKRKVFKGETSSESLGDFYANIIAYCLEKGPDPLVSKEESREPVDDEFLSAQKSLRIVKLLQECARRMLDGVQPSMNERIHSGMTLVE